MEDIWGDTIEKREKEVERSGFQVICNKCGSNDVHFSCYSGEYESSVTIECNKCDNASEEWS